MNPQHGREALDGKAIWLTGRLQRPIRLVSALLISASAATALCAAASTAQAAAPEVVATSASTGIGYVDDQGTAPAAAPPAPAPAPAKPDNPYDHLGATPLIRFWNYQKLELGMDSAPVDPTVTPLSTVRPGWPTVPETTPPMPFTDWPYGGTTSLGDNRTASIDSPLMVATANTGLGKVLASSGIQAYGWVDVGGNISSSKLSGGNAPAAYDYQPNTVQLDQAVLYVERTPDTVQTDHVDWGFRVSAIYGENYRYTTSYGLASYQLLDENKFNGYDFPMVYGEIYFPQVMQGLMVRIGRYISLPDIEAQLAPNNYMYTHSITYTLDNYTNEGIQTTLAITRQFMLQVGISAGTETTVWNLGQKKPNLFVLSGGVDPLYPGTSFAKDPGAQPTGTVCARYQSQDGNDDVNLCANGINNGQWGYNNLQWYGVTAYHKWNQYWHISTEFYDEHQSGVPNANNPTVQTIYQNGGTPFSPQIIPKNAPDLAQCNTVATLRCTASAIGAVFYLNFSPNHLNNFSFRGEYYNDLQGQRTGYKTFYNDFGLGWQHWLSPQIEFRPEFTYYLSGIPAFDAGNKKFEKVLSGDVIAHF
jgi:hypothetical protein